MREEQDRKGGGLMLIYRRNRGIEFEKIETRWCKDVLHAKGKMEGREVGIIVVYFTVKDDTRNIKIKKEIETIMKGIHS